MIKFEDMNESNSIQRNVVARSAAAKPRLMRPAIDIVIPFFNQYESLTRCYSAIMNYTPNQNYRVILVDDCSSNPDFLKQFLQSRKKTIGIRNETQLGFGASVNAGIKAGDNPLVCVMHSDVIPENIYWLYHLQEALGMGKEQTIKFVSSRLSSAGTSNDYPPELIYEGTGDPEISLIETKKPLPWACCLFNRKLIETVGYLKEYPLAWYEDTEYHYRMSQFGYKQAIAMKSVVKHLGGKTIESLINGKVSNLLEMEENSKRCAADIKNLKAGIAK